MRIDSGRTISVAVSCALESYCLHGTASRREPDDAARLAVAVHLEEVRLADEVRDEPRRRPVVDLARRADLLDPPVVHDGDAGRHRHRLLLVVRDVDERRADVAVDLRELDLQPLAQLQVERAERLVEQEHGGPVDERPCHRDALLLPARELAGKALAEALEPDERERLLDPRCRLGSTARAPS